MSLEEYFGDWIRVINQKRTEYSYRHNEQNLQFKESLSSC